VIGTMPGTSNHRRPVVRRARAARPVDPAYRAMARQWATLCADPSLRDLPYKIETNANGTITMSPASNRHGSRQVDIALLLHRHLGKGRVLVECSIATSAGVKVADVAWCSPAFASEHGDATPYTAAPEICIEVASPGNARKELAAKIALYLERGAREVWLCSSDGRMSFHDHQGALKRSVLCPRFPQRI
jgi:Uma2 family endonuclease